MRAGVVTPVATLNPRFVQGWEAEAGIDAIAAVATTAERLGYHHVTCSEHIAIAADKVSVRGGSYWDPLATLGYLAALTSRIRLATHVLVLPFHHPLEIAKRYGTLDRISRGRLILGVGTGSAPEEFELLGVPYARRGNRVDDAIKAVRQSFARPQPAYHGTHYSFDGWVVQPHGVQARVPIWVGGRSERSLRRAVELGDGWAPQGARHDALADMIRRATDTEAFGARAAPLDLVMATSPRLDPVADAGRLAESIGGLASLGATIINVRTVHRSLQHCLEQFEAYAIVAASTGLVSFTPAEAPAPSGSGRPAPPESAPRSSARTLPAD
jgi:probable F420-dependent oxidoreductase